MVTNLSVQELNNNTSMLSCLFTQQAFDAEAPLNGSVTIVHFIKD